MIHARVPPSAVCVDPLGPGRRKTATMGGFVPVTPDLHPSVDLLLDHAAGALAEAPALLVATHLALCPACRADLAALESLGAGLLEAGEPGVLDDELLERTLARLDGQEPPTEAVDQGLAWHSRKETV